MSVSLPNLLDGEDSLTQNLVERGMSHLRTNQWRTQKAGVAILCSLAQTCVCDVTFPYSVNPFDLHSGFGVEALKQIIPEVVNMILPVHESNNQHAANALCANQLKPLSSLLGPAFVMRVLANNGE